MLSYPLDFLSSLEWNNAVSIDTPKKRSGTLLFFTTKVATKSLPSTLNKRAFKIQTYDSEIGE